VAVRRRGKRWAVEVYDRSRPSQKRYVGTFDSQRDARDAEARAITAQSRLSHSVRRIETVGDFAARWLDLRPRQKESTNMSYREQVKPFAQVYERLPLTEVDTELAYVWLLSRPVEKWTTCAG
jgi:hypothetical protein